MKIPVDKMKIILRPSVQILQNIFSRHNYEIRVVGGAVRDLLMDKIPTDLDFATTATPSQMKSLFTTEKIRVLDIRNAECHGTLTAHIEGDSFACSTLRSYKVIDENHKEVTFIQDWERDANRRDLTINAIFLGLDGTLYDYFGGIQHLKERKIKFVDNPDDRIREDPFRILRYFRFCGVLTDDPYAHNPEAISSIIRNRDRLKAIPSIKIMVEFRKILTGKNNFEMLSKMIECGLNDHIGLSPEFDYENLLKIHEIIKGTDYHYGVLLAAGMRNEEEVISFIEKMKGSNKEKEVLLFITNKKMLFHKIESLKDLKDLFVDMMYKEMKGRKLTLELIKEMLLYTGRKDLLGEVNNSLIPWFPVNETHVVDRIEKRSHVRTELRRLLNLWIESDYTLTREELVNTL